MHGNKTQDFPVFVLICFSFFTSNTGFKRPPNVLLAMYNCILTVPFRTIFRGAPSLDEEEEGKCLGQLKVAGSQTLPLPFLKLYNTVVQCSASNGSGGGGGGGGGRDWKGV